MSATDEAEIAIVDTQGRSVGSFRVSLLPRAADAPPPPPLLDLRLTPDRDPALAPVQLLEGHEYRYEIELQRASEPLTTDRPEIFEADTRSGTQGRLRPRLYTGLLPVTVRAGETDLGRVVLEVRSRKFDYLRHYRWMLRDIAEHCAELVMDRFAPAEQRFATDAARDAPTLYQRFAFLQSLVTGDAFEAAIHQVLGRPHRGWVDEPEARHASRGIPAASAVARQLRTPGPRCRWPNKDSETRGNFLPARFDVSRTEETLDTPANRFVKFALTRWRDSAADIGDCLAREKPSAPVIRGLREVEALTGYLDALLSEELFREVGRLDRFPAGDQVLQKREGYRDVFRAYVQFEAAALLTWRGGEDVYGAGQRDVATLYELWSFFQLARVTAGICQRSFDPSALIEVHGDRLGVGLRRGRQTAVLGSVACRGRVLRLELWFNRTFSTDGPTAPSWTRPMRPDCSMRVNIDRETSAPFDGGEEIWLHFDAKYRVEDLGELFGVKPATKDDEEAQLLDDKEAATRRAETKRADLLKMHAYRDAIRRSVGAYVLYPGTETEECRHYHEILPGLGAFALRPTEYGEAEGVTGIRQFILDVIEHVASQVTQHERARFWVREAYAGEYQTVSPVAVAPFLSRPPADTPVLLGHVKDQEHLAWIHATRLYNLRADKRRGSVGLGSRELAAEFVVLHGRPLENPELWQVIGEPRLRTRDQLLSMNYPSPHAAVLLLPNRGGAGWSLDRTHHGREDPHPSSQVEKGTRRPVTTIWLELVR
jgi:predicted component of viral defense system (DUF524 family)